MEVGLAMMLGIGPVQAAGRKPSNKPSARFFFDGLQNQLRSDLRRAQICVAVQHGAPVACDIHPNKLHNEEWFKNKNFHVDTFINLCGHGAVMSISSVFLFPCLFLPAFSLFLCPGSWPKGSKGTLISHHVITCHCGAASKTVFNTELCNIEGAHRSIKSGHFQTGPGRQLLVMELSGCTIKCLLCKSLRTHGASLFP